MGGTQTTMPRPRKHKPGAEPHLTTIKLPTDLVKVIRAICAIEGIEQGQLMEGMFRAALLKRYEESSSKHRKQLGLD